jgi:hypothetical protein
MLKERCQSAKIAMNENVLSIRIDGAVDLSKLLPPVRANIPSSK